MKQSLSINKQFKIPNIGKIPLYLIIVVFVFLLALIQDYIYSRLQHTGFYLSESLLYNTFWVFFIPFTFFINQLIKNINPKNKLVKLPFNLGAGIAFSFLHIIIFTFLFVFVSHLFFTPPHRFSNIFNAALSNQLYIALLWYVIFPVFYSLKHKSTNQSLEKIKLKVGSKIITIPTSSIQYISTDKPYSVIFTNNQKILQDKSLKYYEKVLDSNLFLRVHRSTILNKEIIKELKSRSNGDYDALLQNDKIVRLSRHYRNNWIQLLQ